MHREELGRRGTPDLSSADHLRRVVDLPRDGVLCLAAHLSMWSTVVGGV